MTRRSGIALLFALCQAALFAQQPRSLKEVPIYPGAAKDEAAMADERESYGDGRNPAEVSREVLIYKSSASAEEIFAWYRQKLGATPEGDAASAEAPGAVIKPGYCTSPYEDKDFRDGEDPVSGKKTYDGAWMRDQLKARRKPVGGAWLAGCSFAWGHVDKDGRFYSFGVSVEDTSFDAYQGRTGDGVGFAKKEYRQSSAIRVELVVSKSEGEQSDERDAEGEASLASRAAALKAAPPTAKELGVPLYPGAAFDVDATAGMSGEGSMAYVYLSNDPPAKLVAFYEKATGKKAETLDQGAFRIVLRGSGLFPEQFLSIQPNTMFGGSAKTVLSVFRVEP